MPESLSLEKLPEPTRSVVEFLLSATQVSFSIASSDVQGSTDRHVTLQIACFADPVSLHRLGRQSKHVVGGLKMNLRPLPDP